MDSFYSISRYNWLAQKLYVQQEFADLKALKRRLVSVDGRNVKQAYDVSHQISDHMIYVHGLAELRDPNTTTDSKKLDELISSLERLEFDKNRQYLLLMCQALLYAGKIDFLLTLVSNILNKQLICVDQTSTGTDLQDNLSTITFDNVSEALIERIEELVDNGKLVDVIAEPKLWFLIGVALGYKRKMRISRLVFALSFKLSACFCQQNKADENAFKTNVKQNSIDAKQISRKLNSIIANNQINIANFYFPESKFLHLSVQPHAYKKSIHLLNQISRQSSLSFGLHSILALLITAQQSSNYTHFEKAVEILSLLEAQSKSTSNPCTKYNTFSIKCMAKRLVSGSLTSQDLWLTNYLLQPFTIGSEVTSNLNYLLVLAYVYLNYIIQDFEFKSSFDSDARLETLAQIKHTTLTDQLIESYKKCDLRCQSSAALWNNLGLCFMLKKRQLASMSFLMKSELENPLDWRICLNLAIASLKIGLSSRALNYICRAERLIASTTNPVLEVNPLIYSLKAIALDMLGVFDDARRYHILANSKGNCIFSIVNYLIFLHSYSLSDNESKEFMDLKLKLLDKLEESWLTRGHEDPQFTSKLLGEATKIGNDISLRNGQGNKTYAWSKVDPLI